MTPLLAELADKYGGDLAEVLKNLSGVRGSHSVPNAYRKGARYALEALGMRGSDARSVADALTREQVQRLGRIYDEMVD